MIFSPNDTDPRLVQQVNQLARTADRLMRREVMIFLLIEAKPVRVWRINHGGNLSEAWNTMDPEDRSALRQRFRVRSGVFTIVLIGEDEKERFRSEEPVPIGRLLNVIDTTPERRLKRHNQQQVR